MFKGLTEGAIKFFGLTESPYEGGYMTKDGKMLDFTGRHLKVGFRNGIVLNNTISVEHGMLYGINHNGYCLTKEFPQLMIEKNCVASFMFYTGCIRFRITPQYSKDGYIDFVRVPTEKQIDELAKIFAERGVYITQTSINGDVLLDEHITNVDKSKLREVISRRKPLITPSNF